MHEGTSSKIKGVNSHSRRGAISLGGEEQNPSQYSRATVIYPQTIIHTWLSFPQDGGISILKEPG